MPGSSAVVAAGLGSRSRGPGGGGGGATGSSGWGRGGGGRPYGIYSGDGTVQHRVAVGETTARLSSARSGLFSLGLHHSKPHELHGTLFLSENSQTQRF